MDKNRAVDAAVPLNAQSGALPADSPTTGESVNDVVPGNAAAAGDPSTPPPEVTPEDLAASFIAMIDQFQAQIPNFQHHDPSDIRRVAAIARFAPDLIVPTIATTTSFAPAAQRNLFDVEANQMAIRRQNAFQPVIQRLSALTDGLQFTVNNGLAEAGAQALDVYTWAKAYARRPDATALHPYVAAMSHVVKKVINHRKPKSSTAPAPSPAPAPLPQGAHALLAPTFVPHDHAGEDEFPDHVNKALDRAMKD
ncbi:MAG TPA: hypothetical protein VF713_18430 [Thermoanaerobaculia bacterium]